MLRGPVTPEGRARVNAALAAGYRRWLEERKALLAAGEIDRVRRWSEEARARVRASNRARREAKQAAALAAQQEAAEERRRLAQLIADRQARATREALQLEQKRRRRHLIGPPVKAHNLARRVALVLRPLVDVREDPTTFIQQVNACAALVRHHLKLRYGPEATLIGGLGAAASDAPTDADVAPGG
jgi:hypothetical protein